MEKSCFVLHNNSKLSEIDNVECAEKNYTKNDGNFLQWYYINIEITETGEKNFKWFQNLKPFVSYSVLCCRKKNMAIVIELLCCRKKNIILHANGRTHQHIQKLITVYVPIQNSEIKYTSYPSNTNYLLYSSSRPLAYVFFLIFRPSSIPKS